MVKELVAQSGLFKEVLTQGGNGKIKRAQATHLHFS